MRGRCLWKAGTHQNPLAAPPSWGVGPARCQCGEPGASGLGCGARGGCSLHLGFLPGGAAAAQWGTGWGQALRGGSAQDSSNASLARPAGSLLRGRGHGRAQPTRRRQAAAPASEVPGPAGGAAALQQASFPARGSPRGSGLPSPQDPAPGTRIPLGPVENWKSRTPGTLPHPRGLSRSGGPVQGRRAPSPLPSDPGDPKTSVKEEGSPEV